MYAYYCLLSHLINIALFYISHDDRQLLHKLPQFSWRVMINCVTSDHILLLIMVANEYWSHKSCPYSLVQIKQPFAFTLFVKTFPTGFTHKGFHCLSWNKYTFAAKLEWPWFFPAEITLLAGNAFLWTVCSDFLSDFTRSSLSLHPRLIHYKCLQPISGLASSCTTVACSAAGAASAAVAVCCISGSCFTTSTSLAIFLQWSAASCWPPD